MDSNEGALNVIVVGAGFGGLATAIELTRAGCRVTVYELAKDLTRQGDVIMLAANATRLLADWGIFDAVRHMMAQPDALKIQTKTGRLLLQQPLPRDFDGFPNIYTNRTRLQNHIYEYAVSLGIQFVFGARITEYVEEEQAGRAGIMYQGSTHFADLVIGADSVHSRARWFVMGQEQPARKSGFAVYRSWFSLDHLRGHALTRPIAESGKDEFAIWIAEDTHAILTTNTKLNTCTCFATHRDYTDIDESWHVRGKVADMLQVIDESWDPTLRQIIRSIPEDMLIDHKLLWRDPVPQWVSPGGRVALVGDAAHPHLPTAGTGAAQALEDAATLGVFFAKVAGTDEIPAILRGYQRLRYERTALTQRMGWETRHRWHQTDWAAISQHPEVLNLPQPAWLNGHDAAQYARDNYDAVMSHVIKGTDFVSTNLPDGYRHEEWTIEDMLSKEGQQVPDDFYKVANN
ncbi:hypothetical protein BJY00DRAFT_313239 [Aspergillus carlsbadensis]|nr:hypothetical protein BJY00DRAFT_313239 [Aspergillus carlsbadensis]